MLTSKEEFRLAACLGVIRPEVEQEQYVSDNINPKTILWLAEKLKELNEELKTVNCKCPKNTSGEPPAIHKCDKCARTGSYDFIHYFGHNNGHTYSPSNSILDDRLLPYD